MQSSLSQKTEELMMSYKTSLDLLGISPGHFTAEDFLMIRRQAMSEMMSNGSVNNALETSTNPVSYKKVEKDEKDSSVPVAPVAKSKPVTKTKKSILFDLADEETEDLLSMISG